ncbi:MAG: DNA polymerase ligase N-terminal domain-containing protein, partial [Candidatus Babeliales bacterium]
KKIGILLIAVVAVAGVYRWSGMADKKLDQYIKKRDPKKTPEPFGGKASKSDSMFVIQEHHASQLHWDFRLEIDGVLVSWAIPKGPSTNPKDKRLAVMTEDHPMDYGGFEGVIPEGEYGAGPVMIWDTGTYQNMKIDEKTGKSISMKKCLKDGRIEVRLFGKKLEGGYALIRMKDSLKNWLLIKMKDAYADARRNPVSTQKKSVVSGRTIAQIKKDG